MTKFYELNDGGLTHPIHSIEEINITLDDLIAWNKASYARDLFWIHEKCFFDIDEGDEEKEEKRYFNNHLSEITAKYEDGTLLRDRYLDFAVGGCDILVATIGKQEVYLTIPSNQIETIDCVDATDRYIQKIIDKFNPVEIDKFVCEHSADEVKTRYAVSGLEEEFWGL